MRKLVCIVGPTASGKTGLAAAIARHYGGEVISCDSVQVYRGLDIGSAKPTIEERGGIPHHMIDVAGPEESFSAGRYAKQAKKAIEDVVSRGGFPVVCGGTGLYLKALTGAMADIPPCPRLEHGPDAYDKLKKADPATAAKLSPNDRMRICRALDVFAHTGTPLSVFHSDTPAPEYDALCIGVRWERAELYSRIEKRVDEMFEKGFVDEVKGLRSAGVSRDAVSMNSLGYSEINGYLDGRYTIGEAAGLIKQNTRRYAKRQITWFNGQHDMNWIDIENIEKKALRVIEKTVLT